MRFGVDPIDRHLPEDLGTYVRVDIINVVAFVILIKVVIGQDYQHAGENTKQYFVRLCVLSSMSAEIDIAFQNGIDYISTPKSHHYYQAHKFLSLCKGLLLFG